jgi:hypothetical protein
MSLGAAARECEMTDNQQAGLFGFPISKSIRFFF